MKNCNHDPGKNWDNLQWLAAYEDRVERIKRLVKLSAPYNVVAREGVMILHAIAHLSDNGGFSDPEAVKCVIRFLTRDLERNAEE